MLKQHQIVLQSIKELMKGDNAPVHAVDSLTCKIPQLNVHLTNDLHEERVANSSGFIHCLSS